MFLKGFVVLVYSFNLLFACVLLLCLAGSFIHTCCWGAESSLSLNGDLVCSCVSSFLVCLFFWDGVI